MRGFSEGGGRGRGSRLGGASKDWELPPVPAPMPKSAPAVPLQQAAQQQSSHQLQKRLKRMFDTETMDTMPVQDTMTTPTAAMDTTPETSKDSSRLASDVPFSTATERVSTSFFPQPAQRQLSLPTPPPPPPGFYSNQHELSHPPPATSLDSLLNQQVNMSMSSIHLSSISDPATSLPPRPFSKAIERPKQNQSTIGGEFLVPSHPQQQRISDDTPMAWTSSSQMDVTTDSSVSEGFGSSQQQQSQQQAQSKYTYVPKSELHVLYGKPPRRKIISACNYHTWHDSGQAHMLKWTSVFVCPVSGELFLSGRYGGASATTTNNNTSSSSLLWFSKKAQAEHGAAARAFDCLKYRDRTRHAAVAGWAPDGPAIGMEQPYLETEAVFTLPESSGIPPDIRQIIQAQQDDIRRMSGAKELP